ncbi:MAG: DUF4384 domain-containing protein [Planctomycetes bacterium]|nr:DUF4384 domain-containing protein [Planctomycetota bacterium]
MPLPPDTKIKNRTVFSLKTYATNLSLSLFLCIAFHFLSFTYAGKKFEEKDAYGQGFKEAIHAIPVNKVMLGGKMVRIKAGYLHGVTKGSVYVAYNKEKIIHPNAPTFVITNVRTFSSDGEVQCGSFSEDDLVIEETHVYPYKPIKIFCKASFLKDETLLKEIAEEAGKIPGFEITDIQKESDITLFVVRPKIVHSAPVYESAAHTLPMSYERESPEVWILPTTKKPSHKYLRIGMENTRQGIQSLLGNLRKMLHIREVKKIASPQHKTKAIDLQTIIMNPEDSCEGKSDCITLPNGKSFKKNGIYSPSSMEGKNLVPGQMITFLLTNNSANSLYCQLVNISSDGKIETIYPDAAHNSNAAMIKAGEILDISDEAGVFLNCTGEETIKLFATKEPFNTSLLEQSAYESKDITYYFDLHEAIHTSDTYTTPEAIINSFECNDWEIEHYSFYVKELKPLP